MKATIKDIARACDVTPATVSLALSGAPKRVSPEKRKLIEETARRMHYTPNRAARSLATHASKTIGVIMSDLRNTHLTAMFMALNEVVQASGYSTLCHIVDDSEGATAYDAVREMLGAGVDGVFFAPPAVKGNGNERAIQLLMSANIPVVCNSDYGITGFGADVFFDFNEGGYLATKYLIECGHSRIGCVSGPFQYQVTTQRLDGYKRALSESGIPFDAALVYEGDYTIRSGVDALAYLLGQKATAIFSFNDEMAFGLYQSARHYDVHIPEDVSIIGCDNVPFSNVLNVPLSTVNVPTEIMGHLLADKLINCIELGDPNAPRELVWYKPDLILRGSVRKIRK